MTSRLAAAAVTAVAVGVAMLPSTARAHGETSPLILSVVDGVEPETPKVTFTPVRGVAALLEVSNRTDDTVELLSPRGEPFLRVGPRGAYGNARSEYWRASGNPDGRPPSRPPPKGSGPLWVLASREPRWAYYEHRLHPNQVRLPAKADGSREIIRLLDWKVPFRIAGRPGRLRGQIEFRPVLGKAMSELTSSAQPLPGVAVALLQGRFPGVLLQNSRPEAVVVMGRAGSRSPVWGQRGSRSTCAARRASRIVAPAARRRKRSPIRKPHRAGARSAIRRRSHGSSRVPVTRASSRPTPSCGGANRRGSPPGGFRSSPEGGQSGCRA